MTGTITPPRPSSVHVAAPLAQVTASKATRQVRGLVMPYGQPGKTNLGELYVRGPGRLRLPQPMERHVLLDEHTQPGKPQKSIGACVAAEDTSEGLWLTFFIARTPAGDLYLIEAGAEGDPPVRAGLSVELHNVLWELDGSVASADLLATAAVPIPAYDEARVATVVAAYHPAQEGPPVDDETTTTTTAPAVQPTTTETAPAVLAPAPAPTVEAAMVPSATQGAEPVTGAARAPRVVAGIHTLRDYSAAMAAFVRGERTPTVMAALQDVTNSANPAIAPAAFEGELWKGVAYSRRWVNLFARKPLTHWKIEGYRWVTPPLVAKYAGDKTAVPSRKPTTEAAETSATRFAGANDLDRKFWDFQDTAFVAEYYGQMAEQYAMVTDEFAREELLKMVTALWKADGTGPSADMPNGFGTVDKPTTVFEAAALASAVLRETPNVRQKADYIVVNTLDWLALMKLNRDNIPAFLEMLGVTPETFIPDLGVTKGTLVAGCRPAATFYELGDGNGEPPIRVEALNIANGGVDGGVFGYAATLENRPGAIVSVPTKA